MVVRGASRALVVGDMPFGSYQVGPEDAVRSAVRLVQEGGAHAVKLEGGVGVAAAQPGGLPLGHQKHAGGVAVVDGAAGMTALAVLARQPLLVGE